jgi:DNA-binding LytR/AlgR family response regulator
MNTGEIKILIVEDEFMISEDISMRLSDFGYLVEGVASSGKQALDILEQREVDLALVDINIEGSMDGIELASIIGSKYKIPFIFLTSLANESIVKKAKQTKPSAYLLKPFNDRQAQIAIEMALVNFSTDTVAELIEEPATEIKKNSDEALVIKDVFYVRRDNCYIKMHVDDIIYLSAEGSYTAIHAENSKHLHCQVLKYFEKILPSPKFMRVHRSYIVNTGSITKIEGNVVMLGEKIIPLGKIYRDELFKQLNII